MAVKTHYDNLKVARNAPDDVIRAAYRSLIEKYHPSRNPGPKAARITKILDEAYETLLDPVRRKNHDQWIAREEHREAMERVAGDPGPPSSRPAIKDGIASFKAWASVNGRGQRLIVGAMLVVVAVGLFLWQNYSPSFNNDAPRTAQRYDATPAAPPVERPAASVPPVAAPTFTQPYNATPAVASAPVAVPVVPPKPVYRRPTLTPKGFPWPTTSGYLKGYWKLATNGRSRVLVDNKQGDSDVLVKIVSTDGPTAFPVRVFYVTAHGEFTAHDLPPGTYDVRFCTLADGALSRSDSFTLKVVPDADGRGETAMGYELTLYTVLNGNVSIHPLNPADF